ncbi:hypothetical protein EJ08DRAFT_161021 [Tothia fuscella]|uniref:Uncharacterized protein n=1 Tax=Tothia fuscella TaxID=1048955 RepID=A0A9P4NUR0_9PEZI|nr:hypothetical protein EJ08DRAFT_161021 [Tothia fuscella]
MSLRSQSWLYALPNSSKKLSKMFLTKIATLIISVSWVPGLKAIVIVRDCCFCSLEYYSFIVIFLGQNFLVNRQNVPPYRVSSVEAAGRVHEVGVVLGEFGGANSLSIDSMHACTPRKTFSENPLRILAAWVEYSSVIGRSFIDGFLGVQAFSQRVDFISEAAAVLLRDGARLKGAKFVC